MNKITGSVIVLLCLAGFVVLTAVVGSIVAIRYDRKGKIAGGVWLLAIAVPTLFAVAYCMADKALTLME